MFMPSLRSVFRWVSLLALGLVFLAGCEKDEIRTYTVPRPAPDTSDEKVRLLAAIFEHGKDQWFFKLAGPTAGVDKHEKEVHSFLDSVRFTGKDKPVEWQVPAGWTRGPEDEDRAKQPPRFATFYLEGKALELTVHQFGQISPLLQNVNRWRARDLGLPPLREEQLKKYTRSDKRGDATVTVVDMKGPGPRGKAPPMMGKTPRPRQLAIEYRTPDGWEELGPTERGGIRSYTTFAIRDGGQSAELKVTRMMNRGGLAPNIDRWRGEVGLPPGKDQLDKPKSIQVGGSAGFWYDFTGPTQRSLVVTVARGGTSWYFKLIGPRDLVGKNLGKFESFVQSVKFTGADDE
jgi:hypothetical protein